MKKNLRVLIVEDSESDAALGVRALERAGYEVSHERVEDAKQIKAALKKQAWDVVIADHSLPDMDSFRALKLLKESGQNIPVIVVSGAIGEETAVMIMKAGAQDYVMKANLTRLAPAVERELRDFEILRGRKQMEEALVESEAKYRSLIETSGSAICTTDLERKLTLINDRFSRMLGYSHDELRGKPLSYFIHQDDLKRVLEAFSHSVAGTRSVLPIEFRGIRRNGKIIWLCTSPTMITINGTIAGFSAIITDITDLKKAERDRIQNAEKLVAAMRSMIETIAMTTELRDPYTAGHQRRVAHLAKAIAEEIGLSECKIEGIYMTAIVHDIGKTSVPTDILSKPGKLSELEFDLIKTHPKAAYDVLKGIKFPWPIAEPILQHHERLDGSGYPMGLTDGQICLEAKIIAVADVVETMASHRPYRPAIGIDKALAEISSNKGILYDSNVVNACLRLFTEKAFKFE